MDRPLADLARWVPRLLAVWRGARRGQRRRSRPPPDRLLPEELRDVAAAVERLSHGLTRERELAGARYLDDERLLGAYLLFYWPVSYLQARGTLPELAARPRSVLDLGSGPGPMAFASLDAGAAEAMALDRSPRALAAARALAAEAGERLATRQWSPARPLRQAADGRVFDLVILGHVLNELFRGEGEDERRAGLLEEAAALLRPGGSVLVVEPALRETSRSLLRVRDLMVARGFPVRVPCLFRGPCPALLREGDWCHAERAVEPPPLLAEIARRAGLRREAVKMTTLALAPRSEGWREPPPGRLFRIVSEPLPSKGRLRYMGCGPEGRMGLALQDRHAAPGNRAFAGLARGDVVDVAGAEPSGEGLRLCEGSSVRVVAPAGTPLPRLDPGRRA